MIDWSIQQSECLQSPFFKFDFSISRFQYWASLRELLQWYESEEEIGIVAQVISCILNKSWLSSYTSRVILLFEATTMN
jgi:hypothetical protein